MAKNIVESIWEDAKKRVHRELSEKIYNAYCDHITNWTKDKGSKNLIYIDFMDLAGDFAYNTLHAYTKFLSREVSHEIPKYRGIYRNCNDLYIKSFGHLARLNYDGAYYVNREIEIVLYNERFSLEEGGMKSLQVLHPIINGIQERHLVNGIWFMVRFTFNDMTVLQVEVPWKEEYGR